MSLETYIAAAPKAELHVHLEGSVRPDTLLMLSERNGAILPADTIEGLRQWFVFRDFAHFVQVYLAISTCIRAEEDFELVAYELGAEMARQNIRYAEITFTPATYGLGFGVPLETCFAGLTRGRDRARDEFSVEMRWVFDFVHMAHDPAYTERAMTYTVDAAIAGMDAAVIALGLGGSEIGHSFERIAPAFQQARGAGLHSVPHAGETVGPQSVWGALEFLEAERIGHGVRAAEDPDLVRYLAQNKIALEICPTSNIRLGVFPNLESHPLRLLYDAGVPVTVNSDDPPLFNTTLTDELQLLPGAFDFTLEEIDDVLLNGVRCSFLPDDDKDDLESQFRRELETLKREHL